MSIGKLARNPELPHTRPGTRQSKGVSLPSAEALAIATERQGRPTAAREVPEPGIKDIMRYLNGNASFRPGAAAHEGIESIGPLMRTSRHRRKGITASWRAIGNWPEIRGHKWRRSKVRQKRSNPCQSELPTCGFNQSLSGRAIRRAFEYAISRVSIVFPR